MPILLRMLTLLAAISILSGQLPAQEPGPATSPPAPAIADSTDDPFPEAVRVPEGILDGGSAWFNTAHPISLKELRGKIVVLDFWTYCCINCMHVLPDLKYLEEKYARQLVVIGVHSAKFDNEKVPDNIRDAILRYDIRHPVVNDDQMLIWQRFGTRAWPTLTLIDPEGRYIGSQSGEGNRELFDAVIERLADYHRKRGTLDESPLHFELEEASRTETPLRYPGKVLVDQGSQRVFIADTGHSRIIVCGLDGTLLHVVGNGTHGRQDGTFSGAQFHHPQGMALVGDRLFVADTDNHLIRAVELQSGVVTTFAGTGAQGRPSPASFGRLQELALNSPWDLEVLGDTLFVAMAGPHQIWGHQLGSENIGVFAGSAREDVLNGDARSAAFAQPSDVVAADDGETLFVADSEGSAIRRIRLGRNATVETIAGTSELPRGQSLFAFGDVDGFGATARFQHPLGLAIDATRLFVADSYNHRVKVVDTESGQVASWLGTGRRGRQTEPAELNEPGGLSVSPDELWIADTNNHRILRVNRVTKAVAVFGISGLTAPPPRKPASGFATADAIAAEPAVVVAGKPVRFRVHLEVPEGHKLNAQFPITWEIAAAPEQSLVSADLVGQRREAVLNGETAEFELPLTQESGTAEVFIQVSCGYCADLSEVCRIAEATWKLNLTADPGAGRSSVELRFPVGPR